MTAPTLFSQGVWLDTTASGATNSVVPLPAGTLTTSHLLILVAHGRNAANVIPTPGGPLSWTPIVNIGTSRKAFGATYDGSAGAVPLNCANMFVLACLSAYAGVDLTNPYGLALAVGASLSQGSMHAPGINPSDLAMVIQSFSNSLAEITAPPASGFSRSVSPPGFIESVNTSFTAILDTQSQSVVAAVPASDLVTSPGANATQYGFTIALKGLGTGGSVLPTAISTPPVDGTPFTVTGTGFSGSGNSLTINGVAQTITAQSTTSITCTAVLGSNFYGVGYTLKVTNGSAQSGNLPTPVSISPPGTKAFVNIGNVLAPNAQRIAATPDVDFGYQLEWSNPTNGFLLNDIQLFPDGEGIFTPGVYAFQARANNGADGWGSLSTQTIATPVPVITAQPQNVTADPGSNATFSVTASGASVYQWSKNGNPIGGANGATYTAMNVQAIDNASVFTVAVTNAGGTTNSTGAILTVTSLPIPTIQTQPQNATVTEGQTATFSIVATNVLSLQWLKNGVPIGGATSSSYQTPPTSLTDNNAQFSVQITGPGGTISSGIAVLTVNAIPPPPPTSPAGGRVVQFPIGPFDVAQLPFDFISNLGAGELINVVKSVSVTVYSGIDPNPAAILQGSPTINKSVVTQPCGGGVVGVTYNMVCTITTNATRDISMASYITMEPDHP